MGQAVDVNTFDPLRGFKFVVTIGNNIKLGFQKVSGLKESSEVVEYREGWMHVHKRKMPGLTVYEPVGLTRGVTRSTFILEWRAQVARWGEGNWYDGEPAGPDGTGFRRTVKIELFDKGTNESTPAKIWTLQEAWPSELSVSDLNAEGSEILIETLVLQHEGLLIGPYGSGTSSTGGIGGKQAAPAGSAV